MAKPSRRGRSQGRDETAVREPPYPVPEHAGREAVLRDDDPRLRGRVGELGRADRGERQVTEGAAALPALEPRLAENALGPGTRIEVLEAREPVDPRHAVSFPSSSLGVEKVIREHVGVLLAETQLPELTEHVVPASHLRPAPPRSSVTPRGAGRI